MTRQTQEQNSTILIGCKTDHDGGSYVLGIPQAPIDEQNGLLSMDAP